MKTNNLIPEINFASPAMVDPPHPTNNPCRGCPRWVGSQSAHVAIDHNCQRVYWRGVDVGFTTGEYRVIACLLMQPGYNVSYRAIYDVIQSPGFYAGAGVEGMNSNVRSMIKRIRRKFEKLDPTFNCIVNFQAFGYAWHHNPELTGPVTKENHCGEETPRNQG